MALLKPRNRIRWVHPIEAIYLLGLVRIKPGADKEQVKQAEQSAMDSLARNAERWGIRKIKRGKETGAGNAYYERDLMVYMDSQEAEAGIEKNAHLSIAV